MIYKIAENLINRKMFGSKEELINTLDVFLMFQRISIDEYSTLLIKINEVCEVKDETVNNVENNVVDNTENAVESEVTE